MADRFPSPFDIETPEGAEGWQEMYVYSSMFSPARKDFEDSMFWFQDGVHWPNVMTPWDATFFEFAIASLSQYNTRHLQVPPANGIAFRILNGYGYLSPVPADPATIEERVANLLGRPLRQVDGQDPRSRGRTGVLGVRSPARARGRR
jgi:pyruvate,water dikinase